MTVQEAKDMMQAKLTCFELDTNIEGCDGDCSNCEYNYKQGTIGEQIEALKMAIEALEKQSKLERVIERLEEESNFFRGEPMGTLQKAYYCMGVEKAIEIIKEEMMK